MAIDKFNITVTVPGTKKPDKNISILRKKILFLSKTNSHKTTPPNDKQKKFIKKRG
ncbi:MAG: hypothetical protein ACOCV1_00840 [Bacillota bacterium]